MTQNINHEIKHTEMKNDCYIVLVRAYTTSGQTTESIGAVPVQGLNATAMSKAIMQAEQTAKDRATEYLQQGGNTCMTGGEVLSVEYPEWLYWDDDKLQQAIAKCSDIQQLKTWYKDNIYRVTKQAELQAAFAIREEQLRNEAA